MLIVILSAAKNLSVFDLRCHSERSEESAFRSAPASCVSVLLAVIALTFAVAALAQKKPPAKPIDINTASVEQLQQLPGIGPATAKLIFNFRRKSGPFRRPEDLLAIRGISENRFKTIAPYIVVSQPKAPATSSKTAAAAPKPPSSQSASAAPHPSTAPAQAAGR